MKIKKFISQHRRDFTAIFICEHCNHEEKKSGYDDEYFHSSVIPKMKCEKCGKEARKFQTKHADIIKELEGEKENL